MKPACLPAYCTVSNILYKCRHVLEVLMNDLFAVKSNSRSHIRVLMGSSLYCIHVAKFCCLGAGPSFV